MDQMMEGIPTHDLMLELVAPRWAHHNRIYTDYFFDGTIGFGNLFLNFLFPNPGQNFVIISVIANLTPVVISLLYGFGVS